MSGGGADPSDLRPNHTHEERDEIIEAIAMSSAASGIDDSPRNEKVHDDGPSRRFDALLCLLLLTDSSSSTCDERREQEQITTTSDNASNVRRSRNRRDSDSLDNARIVQITSVGSTYVA